MFCVQCGNQIRDGIKFCPQCGAPVDAAYNKAEQNTTPKIRLNDFQTDNGQMLSNEQNNLNGNVSPEVLHKEKKVAREF